MLWVSLGVKDVLEGFIHKLLRVSTIERLKLDKNQIEKITDRPLEDLSDPFKF